MVDKADKQNIVVSDNDDTSHTFLFWLKKILPVFAGIIILLVALYAVPATRPLINRYLGIAKHQTTGPCSGDTQLISNYNEIMKQAGAPGAGAVAEQARSKSGETKDPSCVYISMMGYYGSGDNNSAYQEYKQLQQLKAEGKLPTAAIVDHVNLKTLGKALRTAVNQKPENPYAQG